MIELFEHKDCTCTKWILRSYIKCILLSPTQSKGYKRTVFLTAWQKTKYWLLPVDKYHTLEWITISCKKCTFPVCGETVPAVLNQMIKWANKGSPHFVVCGILCADWYHHDLDTKDVTLEVWLSLKCTEHLNNNTETSEIKIRSTVHQL